MFGASLIGLAWGKGLEADGHKENLLLGANGLSDRGVWSPVSLSPVGLCTRGLWSPLSQLKLVLRPPKLSSLAKPLGPRKLPGLDIQLHVQVRVHRSVTQGFHAVMLMAKKKIKWDKACANSRCMQQLV